LGRKTEVSSFFYLGKERVLDFERRECVLKDEQQLEQLTAAMKSIYHKGYDKEASLKQLLNTAVEQLMPLVGKKQIK